VEVCFEVVAAVDGDDAVLAAVVAGEEVDVVGEDDVVVGEGYFGATAIERCAAFKMVVMDKDATSWIRQCDSLVIKQTTTITTRSSKK
jgi:hypothetical protein